MRTVLFSGGRGEQLALPEDIWCLARDLAEECGWNGIRGHWRYPEYGEKRAAPGEHKQIRRLPRPCHKEPTASTFHWHCSEQYRLDSETEREQTRKQVKVS